MSWTRPSLPRTICLTACKKVSWARYKTALFGGLTLIGKGAVLKTASNREQRRKSSSLLSSANELDEK